MPPRTFSLEEALEYIADDELVEITPKNIRLRKRLLNATDRKKACRPRRSGQQISAGFYSFNEKGRRPQWSAPFLVHGD